MKRSAFAVLACSILALSMTTFAQRATSPAQSRNAEPTRPETASPPVATGVGVAATSAGTSVTSLVFVPYDRERGPGLKPDQSVLLPYAEFLRLKGTKPPEDSPDFKPVASISQTTLTGTVQGQVAVFEAELRLDVIARTKDKLNVRVPLSGAAVEQARIEGPNATFAPLEVEPGLNVELRGDGVRVLRMRVVAPLKLDGAVTTLDFRVPAAAAASVALDAAGEVEIQPAPETLPATARVKAGRTIITAAAGSSSRICLVFRTRVKATLAEVVQTRLEVEQELAFTLGTMSATGKTRLKTTPLAGSASGMQVLVPGGFQVLNVAGPFVKDWGTDPDGKTSITLIRPVAEPFEVTLDVQAPPPPVGGDAQVPPRFVVPQIRVADAVRENGNIVITPEGGIAVWPETIKGLEPVSLVQGRDSAAARRFRFAQPGWELAISRRVVPARLRSQGLIVYEVTNEFTRVKSRHHVNVSGGGIFDVTVGIPAGYELLDAGPPELVSGFRKEDNQARINLRGEQRTEFDLSIQLQRARQTTDSLLTLEPLRLRDAEEDAGSVVVAVPPALRATESSSTGLDATDVRALQEKLQPILTAELQPALGYRYFVPEFRASVLVEPQRTRLTCDTHILASMQPSLMRIDARFNFNVEFSATDEFQLLLPASVGEDVRINSPDLKERVRSAPDSRPANTTDTVQLTTWTIRLQRRVLGPYQLPVSFDMTLAEVESGKSQNVAVPVVHATRVTRETGMVAVSRGENLEVRVDETRGVEPRDTKDMPSPLSSGFLGFRYFEPEKATLTLQLVKHELESVLGSLIRRMHTDTVVNDQREVVHEVMFEVQNNREQYLALKLPGSMELWSAFVRGMPVRPSTRASDNARLIELTKSGTKDEAFRVRLVLREKMQGGALGWFGDLEFRPIEPLNMPVLRSTRRLFLPRAWHFTNFGGTMNLERSGQPSWIEPAAEELLGNLPAEVAGGVAGSEIKPAEAGQSAAYDMTESPAEKSAQGRGAALEIPIVREGRIFEFSKLSGTGDISVTYVKRKLMVTVQIVIAAIVFLVVLSAMRFGRSLGGGFVLLVIAFVVASLLDDLAGRLTATAFAGAGAAFALGLFLHVIRRPRKPAIGPIEDHGRPRPPFSAPPPIQPDQDMDEIKENPQGPQASGPNAPKE